MYHFAAYNFVTKTKFLLASTQKDQALNIMQEISEDSGLLPLTTNYKKKNGIFFSVCFVSCSKSSFIY